MVRLAKTQRIHQALAERKNSRSSFQTKLTNFQPAQERQQAKPSMIFLIAQISISYQFIASTKAYWLLIGSYFVCSESFPVGRCFLSSILRFKWLVARTAALLSDWPKRWTPRDPPLPLLSQAAALFRPTRHSLITFPPPIWCTIPNCYNWTASGSSFDRLLEYRFACDRALVSWNTQKFPRKVRRILCTVRRVFGSAPSFLLLILYMLSILLKYHIFLFLLREFSKCQRAKKSKIS